VGRIKEKNMERKRERKWKGKKVRR